MKKVLVLVSLGFVALSFSCGGSSGAGGETAANVETAAGMSSAIMGTGDDLMFADSVNADEVVATFECINYDGTIGKVDADLISEVGDADVEMNIIYNKCGAGLCDGHIFMDGTLHETYSVSGTTYTYNIDGVIEFIEPTAGFEPPIVTYYAGKNCGIALAMTIDFDTLTDLIDAGDEAAIIAYIDSVTTGTVCGYEWAEAVDIDVAADGTYCTTLTL